ncbi:QacE family quaternary ammonium compound efflux SMR transporter [bacterium CPR1]|nr:QacE family quaternary ammonium compound efflux SMR transporter [bacterium CPR1]
MTAYLFLVLAILGEIIATNFLKASEGFTRPAPTLASLTLYALAFYSLSLSLRHVPLGVAYAIWSGVGTAATAWIGYMLWNESLKAPQLVGLLLIVGGVLMLNLGGTTHATE